MPPDHNHDEPHTGEEHKAQHRRASAIFNRALSECVRAGVCLDVIFQEVIDVMVQGAMTHDRPLSELVANLIDSYEDMREFMNREKAGKVLKPAGGPQ